MNNTPLSDLAAEYEKTAELLQEQIDDINKELKTARYNGEYAKLTRKRSALQAMFYEVRATAHELRNYYNK